MPSIRNGKDLLFFRPSRTTRYEHIDALFGEVGRNVIDESLIETHFKDLMRVTVSVREGTISSALLLKRLRSGSRRNAPYTGFREVGRVIRTVQLLRYLSDAPLRGRVTAATNKVEAFNGFSDWVRFGQWGTVRTNGLVEQEKDVKFTSLLADLVRRVLHPRTRHHAGRLRRPPRRRFACARQTRCGDSPLSRPQTPAATTCRAVADGITDREREVLTLVGRGLSNTEITEELTISVATAKAHLARLFTKLDARDRVHLVILAYEIGLVAPPR